MSSQNSSLLEALLQTLVNEVEDFRRLVSLTQSERAALQNGNLADLMAAIQGKESLLNRLAQWEQARSRILSSLADRLQLPAASLSDLLAHCDQIIGQKLSLLRQEFVGLAEQLRLLNQGNQLLMQTELVRVNATLNFVLATLASDGAYSGGGSSQTPRLPATGNVLNWQI